MVDADTLPWPIIYTFLPWNSILACRQTCSAMAEQCEELSPATCHRYLTRILAVRNIHPCWHWTEDVDSSSSYHGDLEERLRQEVWYWLNNHNHNISLSSAFGVTLKCMRAFQCLKTDFFVGDPLTGGAAYFKDGDKDEPSLMVYNAVSLVKRAELLSKHRRRSSNDNDNGLEDDFDTNELKTYELSPPSDLHCPSCNCNSQGVKIRLTSYLRPAGSLYRLSYNPQSEYPDDSFSVSSSDDDNNNDGFVGEQNRNSSESNSYDAQMNNNKKARLNKNSRFRPQTFDLDTFINDPRARSGICFENLYIPVAYALSMHCSRCLNFAVLRPYMFCPTKDCSDKVNDTLDVRTLCMTSSMCGNDGCVLTTGCFFCRNSLQMEGRYCRDCGIRVCHRNNCSLRTCCCCKTLTESRIRPKYYHGNNPALFLKSDQKQLSRNAWLYTVDETETLSYLRDCLIGSDESEEQSDATEEGFYD